MLFEENESYEQKLAKIQAIKADKQLNLIAKLNRGETVDITKDEGLFYALNRNNVSMEQFVNRAKFDSDAQAVKELKKNLSNNGWTKEKKMRLIGEIPANIYYSRKEFTPNQSKEDLNKNIKKFLNDFPQFRTVDKRV